MENISWLKDILYLIPLLALVWKGAIMASQIKSNTKDIEALKKDVKEQNSSILTALEKINETMNSIKVDVVELKTYRKIEVDKEK